MTITLFFLGKLLLSSALLYAFYWFVLRNRATYNLSRQYLLSLPMASLLMSLLVFDVSWSDTKVGQTMASTMSLWMQPQETTADVAAEVTSEVPLMATTSTPVLSVAPAENPAETVESPSVASQSIDSKNDIIDFYIDTETVMEWFGLLWVVVSALLIVEALYQTIRLKRMSLRMASCTMSEGYTLIQSEAIQSPCSFGHTIFLPQKVKSEEAATFIKHEAAHIRHAHYVDVWLMELWARLLWFNPFMWLIRSELRNIHEFQADHDVLSSGTDLNYYQVLLLDQVMEGSSIYANGFTHSFIRRRFVEMKRSTAGTLGRTGKVATAAWLGVLFCLFTFGACGEEENKYPRDIQFRGLQKYDTPKPFILHGSLHRKLTDMSYLVYLSDEYMHIEETEPVDTIQVIEYDLENPWRVVKNRFLDTLYIDRIHAGRLRGVKADGTLSPVYADFFFVPGEEVSVYLEDDQKSRCVHGPEGWETPRRWYQRSIHAIQLLRNANRMKSPHQPELVGKCWDHVECDISDKSPSQLYVRQVCFGEEETVIRILPTYINYEAVISSNSYLVDDQGRVYPFKKALFGPVDVEMSPEAVTFGGLYAYEPMPDDVKYFSFYMGDKTTSSMLNIHPVEKPSHKRPNFTLDVNITPGINDNGYLIYAYNLENNAVIDMEEHYEIVAHNRKCHERMRLDEPVWATMNATFPDGTVCPSSITLPFIPGERAEITVRNGSFDVTGSKFYREYAAADVLVDNARKYSDRAQRDSVCVDYFRQHAHEEGCVVFYLTHNICHEQIQPYIPASFTQSELRYFMNH